MNSRMAIYNPSAELMVDGSSSAPRSRTWRQRAKEAGADDEWCQVDGRRHRGSIDLVNVFMNIHNVFYNVCVSGCRRNV